MSQAATAGMVDPHHDASTSTGIPNKKLFMWLFLASDCMFFGSLIATHLIYRLNPLEGAPEPTRIFDIELTSASTFILLMSSLMMALAVEAVQRGRMKMMRGYLYTTVFFGLLFLGGQVYEFHHFVHVQGLTLSNSVFGSTFFILTGTHGCHVAIGVLWLISLTFYSYTGKLTQADAIDVEAAGLYWHFVDIVWIVIFTAVYLIEYI